MDRLPAYCFTVVRGVPVDEVISRLGGDPASPERRTFEECFWQPEADQYVQVDGVAGTADGPVLDRVSGTARGWRGPLAGMTLIAEHNCWRASEDDTAAGLSRGGDLVSFSADVTAVMRFVYAVDGQVVTAFDPLLDRRPAEGADPRALDHLMNDLTFRVDGTGAAAMTLLERATGLRVTRSWLGRRQRAARLPALTT